jgi:hypothetical protein
MNLGTTPVAGRASERFEIGKYIGNIYQYQGKNSF